jgi:DNA-binding transcriptional ArsR family regulator
MARTQNELPRLTGFFKMSHAIFCDSAIRKLSGDSFRLFLWMSTQAWRFPDSDGRVRASLTYIELGTGVSLATISRSLKQLKKEGLVTLIEKDFKHGNVWSVSRVASHDPEDPKTKTQDTHYEPPQNKVPHSDHAAPLIRESISLTLREQVPQNEGQPRTFNNSQETKNSLSAIGSEKLREYFADLAPRTKREREIRAFQELRADYSEDRISQALERLLSGRAIGLKEPCHSPMAFLRHAIEQVLREVDSEESRQQESLKRQASEATQAAVRDAQVWREQEVIAAKIATFEAAFPEGGERQEKIRELTPGLSFLPELSLRAMAAERWSQRC